MTFPTVSPSFPPAGSPRFGSCSSLLCCEHGRTCHLGAFCLFVCYMAARIEWVLDDSVCGFSGCTLPRCHVGNCRAAVVEGKRKRPPTFKQQAVAADVTAALPRAASKARAVGFSEPVSDRLFAARCPRVTVWYDNNGNMIGHFSESARHT